MGLKLDGHGYPTGEYRGFFENRKICVFGGTGTVGSLIVEYIMKQNPSVIRVFSNSEKELWKKEQEWGKNGIRYLLGDVRNYRRVKRSLIDIDYVFNCAAVKHVPKAEYNPMEAVDVNVNGLNNIIDGCIKHKVKKLFHMSTDKACEPTTLMGMTKGICERLLQIRWTQYPSVDMVCVRSGNIWDSNGSLMELVKECQKQDKPIPITDYGMTRFFIKQDALLKFIMKTFKEGGKGDIWIPKMKEVNIIDAIRSGCPEDYPLVEIGRRRGERLKEFLFSEAEEVEEFDTYWIVRGGVFS